MDTILYSNTGANSVKCNICRHRCILPPGGRGICRVRRNVDGKMVSLVNGKILASAVDPIEKKPLFHFLPGSQSFSVASAGCNFSCRFCQNAEIARFDDKGTGIFPGRDLPPEESVRMALASSCSSISFTYTEPTVWFEYALETARLSAEAGLYNIFVTNGYITPDALSMIAPFLHGANIDLKAMSDSFYSRLCGARLSEVLDCIRDYRRKGIWIEITTLVIEGENDDPEQLRTTAGFIAEELGPDTPWHVSRFFPRHLMSDRRPTPGRCMEAALEAGDMAGLRYVYEGNVESGRENTICPFCGATVVGRNGYRVVSMNIRDGSCGTCGREIAGIWGC